MQLCKVFLLAMVGAVAVSSTARAADYFAPGQCAQTIALAPGVEPTGKIVSATGASWASFTGANPAAGTLIDFSDARFATEAGTTMILEVMGQTINIGEKRRVELIRQNGSICVDISEYTPIENAGSGPQGLGAAVTAAPAMPAITIPLVIAGGVGIAYMLGDNGDGATSR
jgi:hypothetical protein